MFCEFSSWIIYICLSPAFWCSTIVIHISGAAAHSKPLLLLRMPSALQPSPGKERFYKYSEELCTSLCIDSITGLFLIPSIVLCRYFTMYAPKSYAYVWHSNIRIQLSYFLMKLDIAYNLLAVLNFWRQSKDQYLMGLWCI